MPHSKPVSLHLSLAALVVLCACLPSGAQKFMPKTIQFKGAPEYRDEELLAAAQLKEGIVLTAAEMKDHTKLLDDSGVFDGITYKFDGVDLVYQLSIAPQLLPVHLENLPLTPGAALDEKIHEKLPLYHGKVPLDGSLIKGVTAYLEEALATEGIHAAVAATPLGKPGTREVTGMGFSILSPEVRVGQIQVDGVSAAMEPKIAALTRRTTGTAFDTDRSAGNIERAIAGFYEDEGYAAVKVHAVRSGSAVAGDASIDVPFKAMVDEGTVYKLGAIHLPADSLYPQADLDKAMAARPAGSTQGVQVRTVWSAIAQRYKTKGFLDCKVTPHTELDSASATVNYSVSIEPGQVYHLGIVKFDNVSEQMRAQLLHNWQMMPGDIFDPSYIGMFQLKAMEQDPALKRSLAGVISKFDAIADPQTHTVNVVIRLEKR